MHNCSELKDCNCGCRFLRGASSAAVHQGRSHLSCRVEAVPQCCFSGVLQECRWTTPASPGAGVMSPLMDPQRKAQARVHGSQRLCDGTVFAALGPGRLSPGYCKNPLQRSEVWAKAKACVASIVVLWHALCWCLGDASNDFGARRQRPWCTMRICTASALASLVLRHYFQIS